MTSGAILVRAECRAFSAGFDIKASAERDMSTLEHVHRDTERQFDFIIAFWDCPKTTVALVHGFCMAGAIEVVLACDITIAAEGTRFGEPAVRFGTGIVAMLLPSAVLPKHAKEMLLTGHDKMDAAHAHAAGPSVFFTKRAMNRTYEILGMREATRASLDIDVIRNATPRAEKTEFLSIRKEQVLKAALAWRDRRFSDGQKS
jgi:enoyl-CoA hydratase